MEDFQNPVHVEFCVPEPIVESKGEASSFEWRWSIAGSSLKNQVSNRDDTDRDLDLQIMWKRNGVQNLHSKFYSVLPCLRVRNSSVALWFQFRACDSPVFHPPLLPYPSILWQTQETQIFDAQSPLDSDGWGSVAASDCGCPKDYIDMDETGRGGCGDSSSRDRLCNPLWVSWKIWKGRVALRYRNGSPGWRIGNFLGRNKVIWLGWWLLLEGVSHPKFMSLFAKKNHHLGWAKIHAHVPAEILSYQWWFNKSREVKTIQLIVPAANPRVHILKPTVG